MRAVPFHGALEALAAALAAEEAEAPLEPGRRGVIRLMNLHKAKGLEAPVVFLADPCGGFDPKVDVRIVRRGESALGFLRIERKKRGSFHGQLLGLPVGWDAHEAAELAFVTAEHERLRYVAATRAKDLLVVSRWAKPGTTRRPWLPFDSHLGGAVELQLQVTVTQPTQTAVDLSAVARGQAEEARSARLTGATAPSFIAQSVTGTSHRDVVIRALENWQGELPPDGSWE